MHHLLRITWTRVAVLMLIVIIATEAVVADSTTGGSINISSDVNSEDSANDGAPSTVIIRRSKRYLDFLRLSRVYFRINMKENLQKSPVFWALGYGYRANFNIENKRRMKRSMVYDTISELISQHGFDGRECIMKSMCEASKNLSQGSGIVFKLFKMIFSQKMYLSANRFSGDANVDVKDSLSDGRVLQGDEKLYPYLVSDDCGELYRHCPLSLQNVSPYTDD